MDSFDESVVPDEWKLLIFLNVSYGDGQDMLGWFSDAFHEMIFHHQEKKIIVV